MATITDLLPPAAKPESGIHKPYVMRSRLDFTKKNAAGSDVVQALNIPAGTLVLAVCTRVITAEGATCTATVGDGSGANSWDASVNLNGSAGAMTQSLPGTDAYATTGKLYSANDTIDLTMGNAAATAVMDVYALCVDLNP